MGDQTDICSVKYSTLLVQRPKPNILHVQFNRPTKLNAMNPAFFQQLGACFSKINQDPDVRVVVLTANGKHFCAGLDLVEYGPLFSYDTASSDIGRLSVQLYNKIRWMQDQLLAIMNCRVPVLAGVHGSAVGGAIDMLSMCDLRYASSDAKFTIKEVDIGMAADIGTLQFMPHLVGNQSAFKELAYTGRLFGAQEAKQIGFVSKVFANKEELTKQLMAMAETIAAKSPVAIWTIKQVINRELKKRAEQGLEYMARVNSAMLLTGDMSEAIGAFMQKRQPNFPKL